MKPTGYTINYNYSSTYTDMPIIKYTKATFDVNNPDAAGFCDRSGFLYNHKDLVRQMEWYGNNKVWTGQMVARKFVDVPNEQARIPVFKEDPKVIKDPRPHIPSGGPLTLQQVLAQLRSVNFNV